MQPGTPAPPASSSETLATDALTDAELLDLVRDGCDGAMSELWRRHSAFALQLASRITDRFDPEDLVSEAFARIMAAISRGRGPTESFRAYLCATVRAVSQNWQRAQQNAQVHRDAVEELAERLGDGCGAPMDEVCVDTILIREAMAALRPRWRHVLWLTEVEGMSPRAAGEVMGVTPQALSALRLRARTALRQTWEQGSRASW